MDLQIADIRIRQIQLADAAAILTLCRRLDRETTVMMLEPDERATTPDEQLAALEDALACDSSTIIVADAGVELAGYAAATGGCYRRDRHSASLVAGVARPYAGCGLGARLFAALEEWARSAGLRRLELTAQARNTPGCRHYEKMGFRVEGTRTEALVVDGACIDDLHMANILD